MRSKKEAKRVVEIAHKNKLQAVVAGRVENSKKREVVVKPFNVVLDGGNFTLAK